MINIFNKIHACVGDGQIDLKNVLRALHEYPLLIPSPMGPSEVLFLAFFLTQVSTHVLQCVYVFMNVCMYVHACLYA